MNDEEPWVMSCGAKDHEGRQRHLGALINWRRRLRGYKKIGHLSDRTPAIIRRSRMGMSECNRRILPVEWRYPPADGYLAEKFRKPLMVVGRGDGTWDGGPVGVKYRIR